MIILDVETTGLDAKKNSLVAIGAIDFDHPEERFYEECQIWDGAEVNPNALKVNGLTEEELRDASKKTEKDIVLNFRDWARGRGDLTIAGHNPHVDRDFINSALERAGEPELISRRMVDQHTLVYNHMLQRGLTPPMKNGISAIESDFVMDYVGIPAEPKPHVAINGALWEYEAIYRLLHDKAGLEEFQAYPIPWLN
jgi:DNA polymerase III epsilon subunit-like protein